MEVEAGAEGEDVEIFITEVEEGTVGGLITGMVLNMMRAWEIKAIGQGTQGSRESCK